MSWLKRFWRDETAGTALEYGLIASLVAVAILTLVVRLGTTLRGTFLFIGSAMP